jgi:hypothetical protein
MVTPNNELIICSIISFSCFYVNWYHITKLHHKIYYKPCITSFLFFMLKINLNKREFLFQTFQLIINRDAQTTSLQGGLTLKILKIREGIKNSSDLMYNFWQIEGGIRFSKIQSTCTSPAPYLHPLLGINMMRMDF